MPQRSVIQCDGQDHCGLFPQAVAIHQMTETKEDLTRTDRGKERGKRQENSSPSKKVS